MSESEDCHMIYGTKSQGSSCRLQAVGVCALAFTHIWLKYISHSRDSSSTGGCASHPTRLEALPFVLRGRRDRASSQAIHHLGGGAPMLDSHAGLPGGTRWQRHHGSVRNGGARRPFDLTLQRHGDRAATLAQLTTAPSPPNTVACRKVFCWLRLSILMTFAGKAVDDFLAV